MSKLLALEHRSCHRSPERSDGFSWWCQNRCWCNPDLDSSTSEPTAELIVVAPAPEEKDMDIAPSDTSDTELPSPLKTEVEFGYQSHTGNSDSRSLNARLKRWWVRLAATEPVANGNTTTSIKMAKKIKGNQLLQWAQSDYKLSPKPIFTAVLKASIHDTVLTFKDYTVSSGLATSFRIPKNSYWKSKWPGLSLPRTKPRWARRWWHHLPEIVEEAIFRGNVNTSWQVLKNLQLKADVTLVSGHSNLKFDTELEAINDIDWQYRFKIAHSPVPR